MPLRFIYLVLLPFLFISCNGQTAGAIKTINPTAFAEKLKANENPQLLDVRTPQEFNAGHIDHALNVNWNGDDFVAKAGKFDKSKPIFVYCKVGGRSSDAAEKLEEMGFTEIYNLEGGFMKWNAAAGSKPSGKIIGMCDQEYGELVKSNQRIMVDFNAKWCAPCQKMKPFILKLKEEMKDRITIIQVDTDENETIAEQMKLEGLPTIIVYENGKEVWRNVGYISEEDLKKHL